ncbi:bifunctional folylpolyglutamate synthase/dihydrofolate synthase [Algoriphagus namhaensis]|uniref:Dihydrofolate synthase/folylpolyglutamate synthase n=1 Tax=Algoriphagus namhaensis TaxID=915353 RepID=A0ABV8AX08_9BACT
MNYQETLDYLYSALPMFHRIGAAAFKKDLSNTQKLCAHLNHPENQFKSIHVAGTNGKGSSSHMLASIFQAAGYKTGLYTSPHLKDFTERARINGKPMSEDAVIQFVEENFEFLDELRPSFFEMSVAMAFWYFAQEQVDIAIIEVGMGGRLDSTNVISPEVSLITSIGYDHMQFLGDTLAAIAGEKAGIIKPMTTVVISQTQSETVEVFQAKAESENAPISFADKHWKVIQRTEKEGVATFQIEGAGKIDTYDLDLLGVYQRINLLGVLGVVSEIQKLGWHVEQEAVKKGLREVISSTGLKGRWQKLGDQPLMICDTGHNESGIRLILEQIQTYSFDQLWMVLGFVRDKDLDSVLSLLPKSANYVFCQADIPRAFPCEELKSLAESFGLKGKAIQDVNAAMAEAKRKASENDLIFIGGSTFVVAEIENL